jgi:hypothetical protein
MEKNMKPSEEKKDTLFDIAKSINEVSQMGNSYGRLAELRDLQIHIQKRINELEKEIEKTNPLNNRKEQR